MHYVGRVICNHSSIPDSLVCGTCERLSKLTYNLPPSTSVTVHVLPLQLGNSLKCGRGRVSAQQVSWVVQLTMHVCSSMQSDIDFGSKCLRFKCFQLALLLCVRLFV